jgi:TetR/AcrR family transcriptional regulator
MSPKTAIKPRRTQERTEATRNKLLDAASLLFTEQGFDGVSIRDLENEADVQRGLLSYHFQDKESLWKAMADRTFALMNDALAPRLEVLGDLGPRERVRAIIRFYVRFSSRHPELPRLLSQEARHHSWRLSYLVDEHISASTNSLRESVTDALGLSEAKFMHWYYFMVGASSLIFSHAPECELLFDADPHEDAIVEAHAEMMVNTLLGMAE